MSKEDLQAENRRLSAELRKMHSDYMEIEVIIQELDKEYERSKGNFPLMRYNKLKRMIKDSTTDEALAKARVYVEKSKKSTSEPAPKSGVGRLLASCKGFASSSTEDTASSRTEDPPAKGSKLGGLLEKCKSFTKKDSSGMTKQEFVMDNEARKKEIEHYYSKFLRAYNRLDKLKREYEQSKGENFLARHGKLKSMIKDVTYDKALKS